MITTALAIDPRKSPAGPGRITMGINASTVVAVEENRGIRKRRTVRDFSSRAVPREIIETAILAAGSAPSGANHQPWFFTAISNAAMKTKIREAAEEEERKNYDERFPEGWLRALAPLGTDASKPHLEDAPALIAVFAERRPPERVRTMLMVDAVEAVRARGARLLLLSGAGLWTAHVIAQAVFKLGFLLPAYQSMDGHVFGGTTSTFSVPTIATIAVHVVLEVVALAVCATLVFVALHGYRPARDKR